MSTTVTHQIPQHEGDLTPEEAKAWQDAQINEENIAGDRDRGPRALKLVQGVVQEWDERMIGLKRRWRAVYHMLAGNTLEKGGPEDVHVPEIWKAAETIVPRVEEQILERQPWFRMVPRKRTARERAAANEAYIDWQFTQAKVRDLIQPFIRDALFTQAGIFYVKWHKEERMVDERIIERTFDKRGKQKRAVKITRKKKITYFGPKVDLVDPFDFIIDTKARDPQSATFVGHRAYMTLDQVRALGKQRGWVNLDQMENSKPGGTISATESFYSWPRDPASKYKTRHDETEPAMDGRPKKVEVVFLYSKAALDEKQEHFDDYLMVVVGGTTVVELRVNPLDGQYRPYAVTRTGKSGHEFYSIGTFDNAIRLNQHLDSYHQSFLAGAKLAGMPMAFAEEDSDFPDTLYKIRPGQVLKGVGPVRFTQIPDGFLRAAPLVIGMIQKDIEETVGAFRINMGQDTGGTATEASLSLQEGNRRTRGLIRAVGDGLEQLLHIFHKMNLQFSVEDVEFPVMGKRGLAMRHDTMNMSPADLLEDVEFEMIGLSSTRQYGMKASGFQAIGNTMAPFIMANAQNVDTLAMLHDFMSEMIGPEEADRYVKVPTPIEQLRSQDEENEALINGAEIEVDPDDDDGDHIKRLMPLWEVASDPQSDMQFEVRRVIIAHFLGHWQQRDRKDAQKKVVANRLAAQQQMAPQQAGGQVSPETGRSSPQAGGMNSAMEELSTGPPGQSPMENPGPADTRKGGKAGRTNNRSFNQSDNQAR